MKKRIIALCAALCVAFAPLSQAAPVSEHAQLTPGSPLAHPERKGDLDLLRTLRAALVTRKEIAADDKAIERALKDSSFPRGPWGVALVVYEPGFTRFKVVEKEGAPAEMIRKAVNRVAKHPRFAGFHPEDDERCRIQLDFIPQKPKPVEYNSLRMQSTGPERFEAGVDGLLVTSGNRTNWFLPGDAFVYSALGMGQILRAVYVPFGKTPFKELRFARFGSESYVSYRDRWLRLFRGYPVQGPLTIAKLRTAAAEGVDHAIRNQKPDGRFLYYYEPAHDSFRDHEHPGRDPKKNPYYNELRHAGGAALLLFQYALTKEERLLASTRKAIDWLLGNLVAYDLPDGSKGGYIYYNRKSKLGGSGLAVYVLSEYQRLTGDERYAPQAKMLLNHLLAQVRPDGEFTYYNIYLDKPVTTAEQNRQYFSFYYPGEALIGMATYLKYVSRDEEEKGRIVRKIKAAMHFLLHERPKHHAKHYTALPSDSWLMMAVNEMWDVPELRDESYKKFVYRDADKMCKLTYTHKNALYPDYPGAFYYVYGDFPYADGARAEGLMGALHLAVKAGDAKQADKYEASLKQTAWAILHLVNTPESTYSVRNPQLTVGAIRFKHTRQWFRIDTIQHVAAFYLKFLPLLTDE